MNEIITTCLLSVPTIILILVSTRLVSMNMSYKLIQIALYLAILGGTGAMTWNCINENFGANLFDVKYLALSLRFDALSSLVYTMIAIIGLVVMRYSRNYLEGEVRHQLFFARLATTIAFVQLLVISGNLSTIYIAWIGTSIGLHKLLLFYPERKRAQLAARKKFIIARIGDLTLLAAFILISLELDSADLNEIFGRLNNLSQHEISLELELAGILLVLTACLKSVQIPFHGWLLEVMETPTPVSALLHAGLLNAGPFLILRFAHLIDQTTLAATLLIIIGALSALFGAIVGTTQSAIKTSLAYSSIGHMGFSLMVCGLGVYSASLLHLVGHSFYKAHAFLSSGSLIEKIKTSNTDNHQRIYKVSKIILAVITSALLYITITYLWQNSTIQDFQLIVISGIIYLAILSLYINTLDSNNNKRSIFYLIIYSLVVINCFYLFEHTFSIYLGEQIPSIRNLNEGLKILIIAIMFFFSLTVLSQSIFTKLNNSLFFVKLEIHLRNGFYINQYMNRFLSSLTIKTKNNFEI